MEIWFLEKEEAEMVKETVSELQRLETYPNCLESPRMRLREAEQGWMESIDTQTFKRICSEATK